MDSSGDPSEDAQVCLCNFFPRISFAIPLDIYSGIIRKGSSIFFKLCCAIPPRAPSRTNKVSVPVMVIVEI